MLIVIVHLQQDFWFYWFGFGCILIVFCFFWYVLVLSGLFQVSVCLLVSFIKLRRSFHVISFFPNCFWLPGNDIWLLVCTQHFLQLMYFDCMSLLASEDQSVWSFTRLFLISIVTQANLCQNDSVIGRYSFISWECLTIQNVVYQLFVYKYII